MQGRSTLAAALSLGVLTPLAAEAGTDQRQYQAQPIPLARAHPELIQTGVASFYGYGPLSRYTASGEVFDRWAMTAAHAWLPFGTRVLVRDATSGRAVTVTITDRLPTKRRVIDLTVGAARELGILRRGVTHVSVERAT